MLCTTQLNHLILSDIISKHSIVQINEFAVDTLGSDNKVCVISDAGVVGGNEQNRIGNPLDISKVPTFGLWKCAVCRCQNKPSAMTCEFCQRSRDTVASSVERVGNEQNRKKPVVDKSSRETTNEGSSLSIDAEESMDGDDSDVPDLEQLNAPIP